MHIEYSCYDKVEIGDVERSVFDAIGYGVNGISIPMVFLPKISTYIPDNILLSCPIDFPNGFADTDLRIHYTVKAANYGAKAVDVVANTFLFINNQNEFVSDLSSISKVCNDRGILLRVVIDYKKLPKPELFFKILSLVKDAGIDFVLCSNGMFYEDPTDNILLCGVAQTRFGFSAISNGNFYLPKHLNVVKKAGIFGARIGNCTILKNCLSVYNSVEEQEEKS